MDLNLLSTTDSWTIALILFVLMVLSTYFGMKFGKTAKEKSPHENSLLVTGIYTLMGLLLAFTFSMAGTRYDSRAKIIIEEANDIGTAILRSQMYPDSIKNLFMQDFKNYLEARIAYSEAGLMTPVNNITNEFPGNFFLSQNFPIPFNPKTNIRYDLKTLEYILVKIYDVIGNEVLTLVNEKQTREATPLISMVKIIKL